jgi:hypothetical protein
LEKRKNKIEMENIGDNRAKSVTSRPWFNRCADTDSLHSLVIIAGFQRSQHHSPKL